ncbi:hypothetical protein ACFL5G_03645 [Candidatus Margulisiibacteriota bacterium]
MFFNIFGHEYYRNYQEDRYLPHDIAVPGQNYDKWKIQGATPQKYIQQDQALLQKLNSSGNFDGTEGQKLKELAVLLNDFIDLDSFKNPDDLKSFLQAFQEASEPDTANTGKTAFDILRSTITDPKYKDVKLVNGQPISSISDAALKEAVINADGDEKFDPKTDIPKLMKSLIFSQDNEFLTYNSGYAKSTVELMPDKNGVEFNSDPALNLLDGTAGSKLSQTELSFQTEVYDNMVESHVKTYQMKTPGKPTDQEEIALPDNNTEIKVPSGKPEPTQADVVEQPELELNELAQAISNGEKIDFTKYTDEEVIAAFTQLAQHTDSAVREKAIDAFSTLKEDPKNQEDVKQKVFNALSDPQNASGIKGHIFLAGILKNDKSDAIYLKKLTSEQIINIAIHAKADAERNYFAELIDSFPDKTQQLTLLKGIAQKQGGSAKVAHYLAEKSLKNKELDPGTLAGHLENFPDDIISQLFEDILLKNADRINVFNKLSESKKTALLTHLVENDKNFTKAYIFHEDFQDFALIKPLIPIETLLESPGLAPTDKQLALFIQKCSEADASYAAEVLSASLKKPISAEVIVSYLTKPKISPAFNGLSVKDKDKIVEMIKTKYPDFSEEILKEIQGKTA